MMKEKDMSFRPGFGEVQVVSDGGYEKGYADGYTVADDLVYDKLTKFKSASEYPLPQYGFAFKQKLKVVDIEARLIPANSFIYTSALEKLVLRKPSGIVMLMGNAFSNSAVEKGTCLIYVPDDLIEAYKTGAKWNVYASQFRPLSEYVEEGE